MSVSFVATANPVGTPVNTFTGSVGFKFTNTTGVTITVTDLGRWCVSGDSQSHTLAIFNSSGTLLTSVSVSMSGAPAGALKYGTLSSSYDILAGTSVYFMSSEVTGLDKYYGNADAIVTLTNIGNIESAYIDTVPHNGGDVGRMFGPVSFKYSAPIADYSLTSPGVWRCAGDQYSLNSLNSVTSAGDTVNVDPGTYTWGNGGVGVFVSKAVNFVGTGVTINISGSAPQYSSGGALNILAAANVSGFVFNQDGTSNSTAIIVSGANGWRIHNVTYNDNYPGTGAWNEGYFVYSSTYGLVDHCTLTTAYGQAEPFFQRGPSNSWSTAGSLGTANAFVIEDCVWNGAGYTDFNSNGRGTVRFNTFNETAKKLDAHGYWTNDQPKVGVRQFEGYLNTFTGTGGGYSAIEIRGGRPIIFGNTSANASASFDLVDYGYMATNGNWGIYQTPLNYPLFYQIGSGTGVNISATALVAYQRCIIVDTGSGSTDFTAIGAPDNVAGTVFTATGPGTGSGHATVFPATEPGYVWSNLRVGSVWPIGNNVPDPGAIALYKTQTSNPSATFTGADIIQSNRDYFADAGAAANTGVVVGLAASMGTAVGKTNQGYWAKDEGSWNQKFSGTIAVTALANNYYCEVVSMGTTTVPQWQAIGAPSTVAVGTQFKATAAGVGSGTVKPAHGRLYVSNGTSWVLTYTPYTYPHPLIGGSPLLTAASINSAGTQLSLTFSESCTTGAGGNGGVTLSASGGAVTATYASGSGSTTYVFTLSRTILSGETITVSYAQPGNGIESTATQVDVSSFSTQPVTNGSASGSIVNFTTLNVTNLVIG